LSSAVATTVARACSSAIAAKLSGRSPWRLSHESVLDFLMLLFSKTKQNPLNSWPDVWFC
jgi:hypothetical protein